LRGDLRTSRTRRSGYIAAALHRKPLRASKRPAVSCGSLAGRRVSASFSHSFGMMLAMSAAPLPSSRRGWSGSFARRTNETPPQTGGKIRRTLPVRSGGRFGRNRTVPLRRAASPHTMPSWRRRVRPSPSPEPRNRRGLHRTPPVVVRAPHRPDKYAVVGHIRFSRVGICQTIRQGGLRPAGSRPF